MAWYIKYYRHTECRTIWTDEWSCACNDHCPKCNAEIEPYDWEDVSVITEEVSVGKWIVRVSPLTASDHPAYNNRTFTTKRRAHQFAAKERARLLDLEAELNPKTL